MIYILDQKGNIPWINEYLSWINSFAIGDIDPDGWKEILIAAHFEDPISVFGRQSDSH